MDDSLQAVKKRYTDDLRKKIDQMRGTYTADDEDLSNKDN